MTLELIERRFDVGAVELNYVVAGPEGADSLLLLHGGGAFWKWWTTGSTVLERLARNWRVYALDLRGHGGSGRVPGHYRMREYVPDVAAFVRGAIGTPAVVIGHSFGGHVGIQLAAEHPDRVRALVVGDSPPFGAKESSEAEREGLERHITWEREQMRLATSEAELAALLRAAGGGVPKRAVGADLGDYPDWYAFQAAQLWRLDPEMLETISDLDLLLDGHDGERMFPAIACPVLLLQADPAAGGHMSDEHVARALALLQDGRSVRLDGVGHLLFLDGEAAEDAMLDAIDTFLAALAPA